LELRVSRLSYPGIFHVFFIASLSANDGFYGSEQILQGRKTVTLFEDFYKKTLGRFSDNPVDSNGDDCRVSRVRWLGEVRVS